MNRHQALVLLLVVGCWLLVVSCWLESLATDELLKILDTSWLLITDKLLVDTQFNLLHHSLSLSNIV
ncbi:MAG TPA: hypothetical protein DCP31_26680 [Cyanobacteria bacterium UBA8543]|nr:hypothetical protein [Cyanobacteria bacterium UBA8543]